MQNRMSYGDDYKFIPATSIRSGTGEELRPDVYYHTIQIVNIALIGNPGDKFVLIDAGMPHSAEKIISVTEKRFGPGAKPEAIILTHGHFDHVGALIELVEHWDSPVYAHELELSYLTGLKRYPEPDMTVEGGMVAKISPIFPIEPINMGNHVRVLPSDGTVPHLPEFRWIHTPGHSTGHVSFYRDEDGLLVAGDAFVTVKQEYLYRVFTQEKEISGPPRYLTPDWTSAWESVKKLEALHPSVAVTGHGIAMKGGELSQNLEMLVRKFHEIAIPDHGRYLN